MTTSELPPPARPGPLQLTPSQTVGPYLHIGLLWPDGPDVVPAGTPGAIRLRGRVYDGVGDPVVDGLVETWQADPDGRFAHPDDPRGASGGFRGFGRCPTDGEGGFAVRTLKPGPLPAPDGGTEAPHIDVSVFARGLLDRVVTRVYFADEEAANAADPVLASVPAGRRATLVAVPEDGSAAGAADGADGAAGAVDGTDGAAGAGAERVYRFDIRLQGEHETVFFDV